MLAIRRVSAAAMPLLLVHLTVGALAVPACPAGGCPAPRAPRALRAAIAPACCCPASCVHLQATAPADQVLPVGPGSAAAAAVTPVPGALVLPLLPGALPAGPAGAAPPAHLPYFLLHRSYRI